MIEIVYYKNHNRLTITGHAQSGEPGKDLVCAGMTADLEPGRCEISCQPVPRMKHVVELIFRSLCSGLEQMAKTYPQYIRYEVHG